MIMIIITILLQDTLKRPLSSKESLSDIAGTDGNVHHQQFRVDQQEFNASATTVFTGNNSLLLSQVCKYYYNLFEI